MISSAARRPPPILGKKTLADDPAQHRGEPATDQLLLSLLKHPNDAVDRLPGVNRVQRTQHQVAGFSSVQGNFHGRSITHLPHQDHLGSLPQSRPQTALKGVKIGAEFTLIKGRFFMFVDKFHRVFQRYHMDRFGLVELA